MAGSGYSRKIFALALAGACAHATTQLSDAAPRSVPSPEAAPGEVIVQFRAGAVSATSVARAAIAKRLGRGSVLAIKPFRTDSSLRKVSLKRSGDVRAAIAALKADPAVRYAEPNYIYRKLDGGGPSAIPNDADFGQLWGLSNAGQADAAGQLGTAGADINILPLWAEGHRGDSRVKVAVIDTGVDWTHPDLVGNLYTNPGEAGDLATNGIDDDGNGFIDDVHGWNFAAETRDSNDDHDHGTHCAGTIGGVGNNGVGVAGVAWNVQIMPIKFLTAAGSGSLEDAVESINYGRKMGMQILSNSWGGGAHSEVLEAAIQEASDAGILFVAAAGNSRGNNDTLPAYPASYDIPGIVSVAAIDNQGKLASFSNYGVSKVHVAAPGVRILSTTKGGTYQTFSGTSMAAPHVTGIAAVLWAAQPSWTAAEIKSRLITTSVPARALKRKVAARGWVDAYAAFHGIVPPNPEPPADAWQDVAMTVESAHPYEADKEVVFPISYPGARYIRVVFEEVDVEKNYDRVVVEEPNRSADPGAAGAWVDEVTGKAQNYTSEYVEGDSLVVRLKSDISITGYGFKISKIQVIMQ